MAEALNICDVVPDLAGQAATSCDLACSKNIFRSTELRLEAFSFKIHLEDANVSELDDCKQDLYHRFTTLAVNKTLRSG